MQVYLFIRTVEMTAKKQANGAITIATLSNIKLITIRIIDIKANDIFLKSFKIIPLINPNNVQRSVIIDMILLKVQESIINITLPYQSDYSTS